MAKKTNYRDYIDQAEEAARTANDAVVYEQSAETHYIVPEDDTEEKEPTRPALPPEEVEYRELRRRFKRYRGYKPVGVTLEELREDVARIERERGIH